MPFITRFSTTTCGAMTFTGNTLGLSQLINQNLAGTRGSIGAFTSLNLGLTVPTFPAGTTLNFTENSSAANLVLPIGSTVLYAELIWGGNYLTDDEDISGSIDNSVMFTDPNLITNPIPPDPATANQPMFTSSGVTKGFYMRSQDVTAFVQAGGGGTYSVAQVPGLVDPSFGSTQDTNHTGWTLAVVYEDVTLPNRSMTLFVGAQGIVNAAQNIDINVGGFITPPVGDVNVNLLISAGEGDAVIPNDQALFGPNAGTLTVLSGPNNPANNFFASQINGDDGMIDMTGTFGTRNPNAFAGTNMDADRQGWDITNISTMNLLPNNQMTAVFRFTSTQDAYMPNSLGIQIDEGDPVLEVEKFVDKTFAVPGEILTYTITITNTGIVIATDVVLTDNVPAGATFIPNSVVINNIPAPGEDPNVGIALDPIPVNATTTVEFKVQVTSSDCFLLNEAIVDFSCGKEAISNQTVSTVCKTCQQKFDSCQCH
ncbi:DUF11 domain-containing protein [Cytobacillus sp. IB215665]|uniref:DUF11 domain-containing protein n=1 Tax=Cytobacillus sp. IB215665 TaxID=3097357 RepID=UPI002A0AC5BA|nr:DUF11 domain-containing protein [Cytobacillus sp. IB215665]MDX8365795.1 DUF11 domain-containing protein [Cytobacillus sp. IB215665]